MGSVQLTKEDEVSPYVEGVIDYFQNNTSNLRDDIGDILVDEMQVVNPIGETQQLNDLTICLVLDEYTIYVFSAAAHFEPVVAGHVILGPMLTEKQRKWWFWYLHNVLGGEYTVKYGTGNKTPENDYPAEALVNADDPVEARLQQFLDVAMGG